MKWCFRHVSVEGSGEQEGLRPGRRERERLEGLAFL